MNLRKLTAILTTAALSVSLLPSAIFAEAESAPYSESGLGARLKNMSVDSIDSLTVATPVSSVSSEGQYSGTIDTGYVAPTAYATEDTLLGDEVESAFPASAADIEENEWTIGDILPYAPIARNQGSAGTCWSFATMATAEFDSTFRRGEDPAATDYSEMALAYSYYNMPEDPLGGTDGDSVVVTKEGGNFLNLGGAPQYAMNHLFRWSGVVSEESAPYDAENPDFSLTSEEATNDVLHIREAEFFNIKTNPDAVKAWIRQHGAAIIQYYGDGEAKDSPYYSEEYNSLYCPDGTKFNHGVAIVGWDDTFDRTHFCGKDGKYPANDGAWLIRNSWNYNEENAFGAYTYFWLSYEDTTIDESAFGASYEPVVDGMRNYQYDGSFVDTAFLGNYPIAANVFTAQEKSELLTAVSVGVYSANTDIDVYIYANYGEDINAILSMDEISAGHLSATHAGIYTIELNTPVILSQGDTFAVVVVLNSNIDDPSFYPQIALEGSVESTEKDPLDYKTTASLKEGQSFLFESTGDEGEFVDLCSSGSDNVGNFRIKAYTEPYEITDVTISDSAITMNAGESVQLSAATDPETDISTTIVWTSSDESVATVDEDGVVYGNKAGTAVIRASYVHDSEIYDECTVTVKKAPTPTPTPKPEGVSMYRMYNSNSGEHFYTASAGEKNNLVKFGWNYEGIGWKAPKTSKTPVYRLYNPNAGDHHYTTNAGEKNGLVKMGWNFEGIGWYSDDAQGVALYRQYNPNAKTGTHNYTTNKGERDYLVRIGWNDEGIGWYGLK